MHSEFREGLDGGSPLLGEFAEQHFASWPTQLDWELPKEGGQCLTSNPLGPKPGFFQTQSH